VQREQLPALEFVMTKQPRVIVGVDMYSYGGQRSENVFVAAEKFLKKCAEREVSKRSNLHVSNVLYVTQFAPISTRFSSLATVEIFLVIL
jgi:hypothetical protein